MMKDTIDCLIYERAPWLQSRTFFLRSVDSLLKSALSYWETLRTAEALETASGSTILNRMSAEIAQDMEVTGLENIPRSGPALIVANHPTGIADALFLYKAIAGIRPDLYFFANSDVLRVFPQLESQIAPVEWRKDKRNKAKTKLTLEYTKRAMQEGRLGVIFPSGRLAKRRWFSLIERAWMPSAVSIAKKHGVPIVPVHISARNSVLFYILDIIHPTLRDITLFNETLNKKNFHFSIQIGRPIFPETLEADPVETTETVKKTVLNLNQKAFLTLRRVKRYRTLVSVLQKS